MSYPVIYDPVSQKIKNVNGQITFQMENAKDNISSLKQNSYALNEMNKNSINMINYVNASSMSDKEKDELIHHLKTSITSNQNLFYQILKISRNTL